MINLKQLLLSFVIGVIIIGLSTSCNSTYGQNTPFKRVEKKYSGYVPDSETAKKVAEAVWLPIYGKMVLDEKPYIAEIIGDSIWIVHGTLQKDALGGTANIEIRIKDCKVSNVSHGM
jgi:hypothetical protein